MEVSMEIGALNNIYWTKSADTTADSTSVETDSAGVSKEDFLQLLVAQLKNQNPLEPAKNENFLAQLATFSSLEQLIAIKEAINVLAGITTDGETASTDTST
jgi:flagellar basal-body rod modification protein FlgD